MLPSARAVSGDAGAAAGSGGSGSAALRQAAGAVHATPEGSDETTPCPSTPHMASPRGVFRFSPPKRATAAAGATPSQSPRQSIRSGGRLVLTTSKLVLAPGVGKENAQAAKRASASRAAAAGAAAGAMPAPRPRSASAGGGAEPSGEADAGSGARGRSAGAAVQCVSGGARVLLAL